MPQLPWRTTRSHLTTYQASDRRGLTLVELLIVLAIVGILVGATAVAVRPLMQAAAARADQRALSALNDATASYQVIEDKPSNDVFGGATTDGERLALLVEHGYVTHVPTPQQAGLRFRWNGDRAIWVLAAEEEAALSSLGSKFTEISQGFISRMSSFYAEKGYYPRSWGDYAFTDIGLDPDEWSVPVANAYYRPRGSRLGVSPEPGFKFTVRDVNGNYRILTHQLQWSIWYDLITSKWYYHSIAPENEILIATLRIEPQ